MTRTVTPKLLAEGQITLVTGAGSGIGRAVALLFAEEGAAGVVAVARTQKNVDETARMVEDYGCKSVAVSADLTTPSGALEMVAAARQRFGRLDSAVNCAGDTGPIKPILDYSDEEWRGVHAINVDGTFYCMRAEIPLILDSGGGAIVNVSSGSGIDPIPGMAAYSSSKFGMQGLGRAVAGEVVARSIRINTVQPGGTRTGLLAEAVKTPQGRGVVERIPLKRLAETREVAEPIVWLCSPRASYITGAELPVTGGLSAFSFGG